MARPLAFLAMAGVCVAVGLVLALSGGGSSHELRAVFAAATQLRSGNQVRIAGRVVGDVQSVSLSDDAALVRMSIDSADWPLHAGTTAELRFGAAASYASRYVQLAPGPNHAASLPDDALLPEADTVTPVEFDQLLSTFNKPTEAHIGQVLHSSAALLKSQSKALRRDLTLGSAGIGRVDALMSKLDLDPKALAELINSGADTFQTLSDSDSRLQGLVSNAAQTFSVLADNAHAVQRTIAKLPATLTAADGSLAHLDRSLTPLGTLVADLRPGAQGLATDAPLLRSSLNELVSVAPTAIATLRTGAQQLPKLTALLRGANPFVPNLTKALSSLAPMVACVRPYTPEIAGWLETWQGGPYDKVGPFGEMNVIQTATPPGTSETSAQVVAGSSGQLSYAFPRPPGLNAGQPWFQPQCGAGPDALNPADDPEATK